CDFLTTCLNTPGGRSCGECPKGYEGSGEAGCKDVDECGVGEWRGGCHPNATCINTDGGSKCGPCEPAELYKGDGYTCRASSSCAVDNGGCDALTTCSQDPESGAVTCGDCPTGMTGSGSTACVEIDGCALFPCFEGVECEDVTAPGVGAVCDACPQGLVGDGRTCAVDVCAADPPPCSSVPHVNCSIISGGSFMCWACPPGYSGDGTSCVAVDECQINNGGCHYLSACLNTPGGRSCGACPEGYQGTGATFCRKQQASCAVDNGGCDERVTCTEVDGADITCGHCPEGYAGNGVIGCVDADGCEEWSCYPGVHCEDVPAQGVVGDLKGHRCGACPVGMIGDGVECATNTCFFMNGGCDPMVVCIVDDTAPAGRVCGVCPEGFTDEHSGQDGTRCEDIDGCRDMPCFPGVACTDVAAEDVAAQHAAFRCEGCPAGYTGDGVFCADVDECSQGNGGCWTTKDGTKRSECLNTEGGFQCAPCPDGFRGSGLTGCQPISDCAVDNGGCWVGSGAAGGFAAPCNETEHGSVCSECPAGFAGHGSTGCVDIDGCADDPCFEGVTCKDVPAPGDGRICGQCPEGYRGDGSQCTLCRLLVNIPYTTVVEGRVFRAGWHRGERDLISGKSEGLDDAACVYTQGLLTWWTGAASDGGALVLDDDVNKASTMTLNIPKADLKVGVSYTFRLQAVLVGNPHVRSAAVTSFFVQSQPLVIVVSGGDATVGSSTPIALDASDSLDPDAEAGEITFTWRCNRNDNTDDCRDASGALLPATMRGHQVSMRLQGSEPAVNYTFTVVGAKGARRGEVSVFVSVSGGAKAALQIEPLLDPVNSGDRLRLRSVAASVAPSEVQYSWAVVPSQSSHPLRLSSSTLSSIDSYQADLILTEGALAPGGVYTFRLTVADSAGSATTQTRVEVNQPPIGGRVTALTSADGSGHGIAYSDMFDLKTFDWEDADPPLLYSFSYRVVRAEVAATEVAISLFAPAPTHTSEISAAGLETEGFAVTVIGMARDSLGAVAWSEVNITVTPPFDQADSAAAEALAADLAATGDKALLDGNVEGALVQVDSIITLLQQPSSGALRHRHLLDANATASSAVIREDAIDLLGRAQEAVFPSGSTLERFAAITQAATALPQELTSGAQQAALQLVEALVQDTRADPAASPLSQHAASAVCASLAALNAAPQETGNTNVRAAQVASTMGKMKASMLEGTAAGEQAGRVAADGLAMTVARNDASSPNSPLYTSPLTAEGTSVVFPSTLLEAVSAAGARRHRMRRQLMSSSTNCSASAASGSAECYQVVPKVVLDSQLMTSEADPHFDAATADPEVQIRSDVTTISLSLEGEEEYVGVEGLEEAVIFSLPLGGSGMAPYEDSGGMRGNEGPLLCNFWNTSLGAYSTAGCVALPNPAPPGAQLHWKNLSVSELLPWPLESAWSIGNSTLMDGCIETFEAAHWRYKGADAGLRKYLSNTSSLQPGGGLVGCELAKEENALSCWWNWTFQIFSGPGCQLSPVQQCFCTHLTDFKAQQEVDVESKEPPRVKMLRGSQFRLSIQNILKSGVLLTLVASIIGVASYLAMCSAAAHNEARANLLRRLALPRGTGKHSFYQEKGVWTWSLFSEEAMLDVAKLTQRANRCDRRKAKLNMLEQFRNINIEDLASDSLVTRRQRRRAKQISSMREEDAKMRRLNSGVLDDKEINLQDWRLNPHKGTQPLFPETQEEYRLAIVVPRKQTRTERLLRLGADSPASRTTEMVPNATPYAEAAREPSQDSALWNTIPGKVLADEEVARQMMSEVGTQSMRSESLGSEICSDSGGTAADGGMGGHVTWLAAEAVGDDLLGVPSVDGEGRVMPVLSEPGAQAVVENTEGDGSGSKQDRQSGQSLRSQHFALSPAEGEGTAQDNQAECHRQTRSHRRHRPRLEEDEEEVRPLQEDCRHQLAGACTRLQTLADASPQRLRGGRSAETAQPHARSPTKNLKHPVPAGAQARHQAALPRTRTKNCAWKAPESNEAAEVGRVPSEGVVELHQERAQVHVRPPSEEQRMRRSAREETKPRKAAKKARAPAAPTKVGTKPLLCDSPFFDIEEKSAALELATQSELTGSGSPDIQHGPMHTLRVTNEAVASHPDRISSWVTSNPETSLEGAQGASAPPSAIERSASQLSLDGAQAARASQKRSKALMWHQENAVSVLWRLEPFIGRARSMKLAASYLEQCKLRMQPHCALEARGLETSSWHCRFHGRGRNKKQLILRLRVFCIFVTMLERVQDLHVTEHLCGILGIDPVALHLCVPVDTLRFQVTARKKAGQFAIKLKSFVHTSKRKHHRHHTAEQKPIERMLGSAAVMAFLEVFRLVRREQIELQNEGLEALRWDMPNERPYSWYLDLFRGLMTTVKNRAGWYHSRVLWSLVFMQNTDGSFELTPNLATVLCAGETSYILTDKPTGHLSVDILVKSVDTQLLAVCHAKEHAERLWATLCVVERMKKLPFEWTINPVDPPIERRSLTQIAEQYVARCFEEMEKDPELYFTIVDFLEDSKYTSLQEKFQASAREQVAMWVKAHVKAIARVKSFVENDEESVVSASRETPIISLRERREEAIEQLKRFGMAVVMNHPWMKIAAVGPCEAFSRTQRIMTEVNSILIMLLCCLWFFYSRATICCENLQVALRCNLDEAGCHGMYSCAELQTALDCDRDLTCPAHQEALPSGFTCTAFPQNTLSDKMWLAVYILLMNVPLKLFFITLFTVGGAAQTPEHWNAGILRQMEQAVGSRRVRWVEHIVFLVYSLLLDHMGLTRAMARIFGGLLLLLDSTFLGSRLAVRKFYKAAVHLKQSLWFLFQIHVLKRSPHVVFEELRMIVKKEEESQKLDEDAEVFEQVRHEMDSGFAQLAITLLVTCWMAIIYILLVYSTLIRESMGSSAEKKILQVRAHRAAQQEPPLSFFDARCGHSSSGPTCQKNVC
ncbi:hypothetical protein CYMTET_8794, partial [Cymbomonas tetramitiformis]